MPLFRRVPKHGFNNPLRTEHCVANVGRIQAFVDEGRIDAEEPVTPEVLEEAGLVRSANRVKVLGDGRLDASLEVSAHAFSSSAEQKIEDSGGTVTKIGDN